MELDEGTLWVIKELNKIEDYKYLGYEEYFNESDANNKKHSLIIHKELYNIINKFMYKDKGKEIFRTKNRIQNSLLQLLFILEDNISILNPENDLFNNNFGLTNKNILIYNYDSSIIRKINDIEVTGKHFSKKISFDQLRKIFYKSNLPDFFKMLLGLFIYKSTNDKNILLDTIELIHNYFQVILKHFNTKSSFNTKLLDIYIILISKLTKKNKELYLKDLDLIIRTIDIGKNINLNKLLIKNNFNIRAEFNMDQLNDFYQRYANRELKNNFNNFIELYKNKLEDIEDIDIFLNFINDNIWIKIKYNSKKQIKQIKELENRKKSNILQSKSLINSEDINNFDLNKEFNIDLLEKNFYIFDNSLNNLKLYSYSLRAYEEEFYLLSTSILIILFENFLKKYIFITRSKNLSSLALLLNEVFDKESDFMILCENLNMRNKLFHGEINKLSDDELEKGSFLLICFFQNPSNYININFKLFENKDNISFFEDFHDKEILNNLSNSLYFKKNYSDFEKKYINYENKFPFYFQYDDLFFSFLHRLPFLEKRLFNVVKDKNTLLLDAESKGRTYPSLKSTINQLKIEEYPKINSISDNLIVFRDDLFHGNINKIMFLTNESKMDFVYLDKLLIDWGIYYDYISLDF